MKNLTSMNVDDCFFEWQFADGSRCKDVYAAHDQGRDVFAVVLAQGRPPRVVYRENRMHCHIDDAWTILAAGRFAEWKTCEMLVTLRQALRERFVQAMPLDMPKPGIGKRALQAWMRLARAYDTAHHGAATF